ncbi:Ribosomal protein L11 methyltransferase [Cedecea neteri]|uniref:Ribosomal protein L11 methyltransferase n=1 Tax=Cedecea neteri TaxID=158822 RepID=A0A2X2T9T8_9ENTR|nr:Ribosomal protein L11 methyltransferase [Cedecea neteri]
MPWIQLKINTTGGNAESLGDALIESGAVPSPSRTPTTRRSLNRCRVKLAFGAIPTLSACMTQKSTWKKLSLSLKTAHYWARAFTTKSSSLEDKDWEREWMDNFHPMRFGNRLWICPSWRDVPDENAVNVMLDPGLAFGTGTHPTTSLCLEWLDGLDLAGKTIIDFGCGSGILAIAALKLGCCKSHRH